MRSCRIISISRFKSGLSISRTNFFMYMKVKETTAQNYCFGIAMVLIALAIIFVSLSASSHYELATVVAYLTIPTAIVLGAVGMVIKYNQSR
ncbi:hypothetical protein NTE_03430 [Candidatus Nitrososphaera evergladensis SR1]|uniref:Uncharacterized protein n=1 Tax=Candidatus Nitrososphaera evergladensis SR1 TaxID=1459636 RepID=A0A075MWE8_9ARCH|nr:hypothetical protein NTE_03430 [Candidatus Nitrososphaera evergladensis SR1]